MRQLLKTVLLLALPLGSAGAQLSQVDMTDKEILEFLSGNTIGAYDWGTEESYEYHSPDGQAVWQEGETIEIGYYRVKDGQVCYTYEGPNLDTWYCWTFRKDRRNGDVYQWGEFGNGYRLYIHGEGDLVSPSN